MRRRELLLLAAGAVASQVTAVAYSKQKMLRVATANAQPRSAPQWLAFIRRMAELGYKEGENFTFDHLQIRSPEVWEAGYREILGRNPDVVIATGPALSLRAAVAATTVVPIVMIAIDYDPIALGFVASLSRPGGNITGVHFQRVELTAKRLQLFKDAFPDMSAAIVFWDDQSGDQWEVARTVAPAMGIQLVGIAFRERPYDYEKAIAEVPPTHRKHLFVLGSPFFFADRKRLAQFAAEQRSASSFVVRDFVEAGGLMSYGASLTGMWELAATYVERIARGADPGNLPIQQPTKFDLAINLRAAKALGITLPPDLLLRADEVID